MNIKEVFKFINRNGKFYVGINVYDSFVVFNFLKSDYISNINRFFRKIYIMVLRI